MDVVIRRSQIVTIDQYWHWLQKTLSTNLRAQKWYNGQSPRNLSGFLNDKSSRLIGWATMRQLRVQSESCHVTKSLQPFFVHCQDDYSFLNEEKRSFEPGWENITSQVSNVSTDRAFQYQSSQQLDTYFTIGNHHTYAPGGYVYEFRGRLSDLQSNLSQLHKLNWIDGQTRAVIVEFTLYNPNVQLFTSVSLLAEFMATGGMETQSSFQPISFESESRPLASTLMHLFHSLCIVVSSDRQHPLPDMHRSHDDGRSEVIDQTEARLLSSAVVLHRRGDQIGRAHV